MSGNFGNQESENKSAGLWQAINLYLDIGQNRKLSKKLLKELVKKDPNLSKQLTFLGMGV